VVTKISCLWHAAENGTDRRKGFRDLCGGVYFKGLAFLGTIRGDAGKFVILQFEINKEIIILLIFRFFF